MEDELKTLINRLVNIQDEILSKYGLVDIYSSSKIFEIIISDCLNHILLPSHAGSRDGKDDSGEYEYKHYKESSSNHSWTFNDFSDTTIEKLNHCYVVIFAHIEDQKELPEFDWFYQVPGKVISGYLKQATIKIKNTRKMINVSPSQIESVMGINKTFTKNLPCKHFYTSYLKEIFSVTRRIEKIVGTKDILTSNKLWEILVSLQTGHKVLSEQKAHDAVDEKGEFYEYKVARNYSWNFEDISPKVLSKFLQEKAVVLAIIDKARMKILKIFFADPIKVVKRLEEKLEEKRIRFSKEGKVVRRLQVSLSAGDLAKVEASQVFPR
ncbi:hypothetical protein HY439_03110 [Candidatus Microgenomates bacterium]|nr:hypothetical protein [Candidatus Microgenomates bacterium]